MHFLWIAAAVAVVDQLSKAWVSHHLVPGASVPIWPPWLYLSHVENTGAAFGLFRSHGVALTALAAGVVLAAVVWRHEVQRQPMAIQRAVGLGLGGTIGNLIDRVGRGAVLDFIDFRIWPVFNVADVAIVAAALLLVLGTLRGSAGQRW